MRLPLAQYGSVTRRSACPGLKTIHPRLCFANQTRSKGTRHSPDRGIPPIPSHAVNGVKRKELRILWDKYNFVDGPYGVGPDNVCVGLIGKARHVSKHLSFADLTLPSGEIVQLCSNSEGDEQAHQDFREVQAHSPVTVRIKRIEEPAGNAKGAPAKRTIHIETIRQLNSVPEELIVTPETQFMPAQRHLQIRFHPELQARLKFRSWLKGVLNRDLEAKGFTDVETPILFKSTPEGAREFLVPSRIKGRAYALSQSPQQYKQVLMASGISRYMQWARCFRDEDLRADRQPEFSQLDMEWAFAGAETVKRDVSDLVVKALEELRRTHEFKLIRGEMVPVASKTGGESAVIHQFTNLTFQESIAAYGTDKPDLRIPLRIHAFQDDEISSDFVGMITDLADPMVEAFAFPVANSSASDIRNMITNFMDNLPPALAKNEDGAPQVLIYDSSKPMCGFSSLGFGYENVLNKLSDGQELSDGDVVVFQARNKPVGQYYQASTKIGEMRSLLWKTLVDAGHMKPPQLGEPGSLRFAWITEFPMFKVLEVGEPGQGGMCTAGAAHHPFTAPLSRGDMELLFTDPMQAKSGAYDLVLNGVEVGGGSVRNHIFEVQEYIMKFILRMHPARLRDFEHLFRALRAGCPPHAGFALGFDRLVALMSGTQTVRDVIAFPKSMKGEDLFVRSPGQVFTEQLEPLGLLMRSGVQRASLKPKKSAGRTRVMLALQRELEGEQLL